MDDTPNLMICAHVKGKQSGVHFLRGPAPMVSCQCLPMIPKHKQQGVLMGAPRLSHARQLFDYLQQYMPDVCSSCAWNELLQYALASEGFWTSGISIGYNCAAGSIAVVRCNAFVHCCYASQGCWLVAVYAGAQLTC